MRKEKFNTDPMPTEELKSCPFCGGEAEIVQHGTARASMQIACTNCGAFVESGDVFGLTKPERWKWNTRPLESKLKAQGMREAVDLLRKYETFNQKAKEEAILSAAEQMEGETKC